MDLQNYNGVLKSNDFHFVIKYLKSIGIKYLDNSFGFDRFYWNKGLYKIIKGKVKLIYALELGAPFEADCLDCTECIPQLRPRLA